MTEAETFGTYERVYLGERIVQGKRVYAWADLEQVGTEGTTFWPMLKQVVRSAHVGAIYRFTWADAEHTQFFSKGPDAPVYMRMFPDAAILAAFQTDHRATQVVLAAQQQERKEGTADYIAQALRPLRAVYARATPRGKLAIELLVVDALRRGE